MLINWTNHTSSSTPLREPTRLDTHLVLVGAAGAVSARPSPVAPGFERPDHGTPFRVAPGCRGAVTGRLTRNSGGDLRAPGANRADPGPGGSRRAGAPVSPASHAPAARRGAVSVAPPPAGYRLASSRFVPRFKLCHPATGGNQASGTIPSRRCRSPTTGSVPVGVGGGKFQPPSVIGGYQFAHQFRTWAGARVPGPRAAGRRTGTVTHGASPPAAAGRRRTPGTATGVSGASGGA